MDCFSFNDEEFWSSSQCSYMSLHPAIYADRCFGRSFDSIQRLENRLNEYLSKLEEIGERAENEPQMPNIVPSSLPEITSISANHDKKISTSSSVSFANDQCMESSVCLPSLSSEKNSRQQLL
ncbi:hypothetical protein CEXT_603721 [Caerostris extrusa]|uniref:Uncharacterized protein n=1 Tax=Caerostris extrusa TaxID=172846 RepID=A0AAV4NSQ5_CAEEX|nr:hypothetical protein CEXT_603721 [Caerostris extrusa]